MQLPREDYNKIVIAQEKCHGYRPTELSRLVRVPQTKGLSDLTKTLDIRYPETERLEIPSRPTASRGGDYLRITVIELNLISLSGCVGSVLYSA
jgi:hypothetical protein